MQSDEKEDNDCYLRGQLVEPTGDKCHSCDRSWEMRDEKWFLRCDGDLSSSVSPSVHFLLKKIL